MGDYHVHLHPHGPYTGEGPPPGEYPPGHIEAYVETALERGAEEVGFTEHLYRCVEAAPVLGPFWEVGERTDLADLTAQMIREDQTLSLGGYVDAVLDAQEDGLPVLLGLEVDFDPETIEAVLDLLEPYPWDFLIGSVHWVGEWTVDHGPSAFEYDRRGVDRAYEDYFALEIALAASGAVDVLAHCDVVKKHGHRPSSPPTDHYHRLARAAERTGTAVEVSTAGLRHKAGEIYPAPELLAIFAEGEVPITLASDAHQAHDTGRDRDVAIAAARAAGYTERIRFRRRAGWLVPLEADRDDG
jgi:histidinol-phosphatase (PHP family)